LKERKCHKVWSPIDSKPNLKGAVRPLVTLFFTNVAYMHLVTHSVLQGAHTLVPLIACFTLLVRSSGCLYFTGMNDGCPNVVHMTHSEVKEFMQVCEFNIMA
jgi:hypothetical protein